MNDPVLQFPCIVEIVSPLHIGTGERLSWTSMVKSGSNLYVIDERLLLARVSENADTAAAFVACVENPRYSIGDYLDQHHISPEQVASYKVALGDNVPNREILPFIKNPRFYPYMPGSSLKGALRTSFLQTILQNRKFQRRVQADVLADSKKGHAKSADDAVEQEFFGPDPHHDWMRVFQIADTNAISPVALQVMEVRTLSSSGTKLRPKTFSIYPETLSSKCKLRTTITLNTYLFSAKITDRELKVKRAKAWALKFINRCNLAAKRQIKNEIAFYQQYRETKLQEWYQKLLTDLENFNGHECLLWMGWGSGYGSKGILSFFDTPTQDQLRLNYELGKIVHQACGERVGHARRPKGSLRWYCRHCRQEVDDRDVKLVSPFPKSRKVALTDSGDKVPLGWIKLRI